MTASSNALFAEDQVLQDLSPLAWKNRIILQKTDTLSGSSLNQLRSQMRRSEEGLVDRDIYWFILNTDGSELLGSNYQGAISDQFASNINTRYFVDAREKTILIGKDGGVKDRSESLNITDLFQQIDRMPMRRAEMLEK